MAAPENIADSNGGGMLTKEEALSAALARFAIMDIVNNGQMSEKERKASREFKR